MLRDLLPARLPDDVWAGRLPVRLGGQQWMLPVLPMAASDRWRLQVTAEAGNLWYSLGHATDFAGVMAALAGIERDTMRRLLLAWDDAAQHQPDEDRLPADVDWWYEHCTDIEVLRAFVEVWAVANPTLAAAVSAALTMPQVLAQVVASTALPLEATNGSQPDMAGAQPEPAMT